MDRPLSGTNPQQRLPIRNFRPILHRHPLSPNYLLKRSPKYLHCNFVDNFRSPSQQNSRLNISKALQRAKYLQKLHRLQPLVTYKQYLRLLKRHNQNIDNDGIMHTLYSKPLSIVKIIMKKFKCIKKFNVRFNILNSGCIKYAKQLKMLSIATKASSDSRFSNAIMQVLKKTGRRLKHLKKVSIETGESFQDRTIMRELLENFQKFQFLKEIHIRFQHLDLRKFDTLAPIDFNGINKGLIASLHSIPHPTLLANILKECALFKQLKQLTFKLPLLDVQRYQNFDFKILENLSRFENLQILGITLELCETYNDLFVDHIRFPQSLRKLNFEVERLDFRRLYEGKREDIKTFFNHYQALHIEDLALNITINQHYLATYTEFIRPFLRTQQNTLKNLTMKFGFALPTAKQKERKILHVSEVFEDINLLKSLKSFEWNFEVLDFTPRTGTKPIEHINLLNAVVSVQEVLWQENTARKSFIEETLKYLANCKNIKKILLQNKGNKEPESLRRSLNALVQFTNIEKVHIDWNMDALKVENLCRYLDYVKKLTNVTFLFKQILLTRDDLDAIRNSLARNKALIEARISLLNGDVVKHGRDGTPYESGSNWPKK